MARWSIALISVLAPRELADYVVSRDREYGPGLLTSENRRVFLFAPDARGSATTQPRARVTTSSKIER